MICLSSYTYRYMIPSHLKALFWDVDLDTFRLQAYPEHTIFRVMEYDDVEDVAWLRQTFPETEIRRMHMTESRLSEKSANFWTLRCAYVRTDQVLAPPNLRLRY